MRKATIRTSRSSPESAKTAAGWLRAEAIESGRRGRRPTAYPLAFDWPEVELAAVGGRRQISFLEEEDFTANAAQTRAQRPINLNCVGPCLRVVVAHVSPEGVVVKGAAYARAPKANCAPAWE